MRQLYFVLTLFVCCTLQAQNKDTLIPLEIIPALHAKNIGGISQDTLTVVAGTTYAFTVDTPGDSGLVSTKISPSALMEEVTSRNGSRLQYKVTDKNGSVKSGDLVTGDHFLVSSTDGRNKTYEILVKAMALSGQLVLQHNSVTARATHDLVLFFTAGQRTPNATVRIFLPPGIEVNPQNTTVNVIGRGDVRLQDLATQSMGRLGSAYTFHKVGNMAVSKLPGGGSVILFKHLDLRPANGPDLTIVISDVSLSTPGSYAFSAMYQTSKPEVLTSAGTGPETAVLTVTDSISDFMRIADRSVENTETHSSGSTTRFRWGTKTNTAIRLMQSVDQGKTWAPAQAEIDEKNATARATGLMPNRLYAFRLFIQSGPNRGYSNTAYFYAGKMDVRRFGVTGEGDQDNTEKINEAITYLGSIGGGILLFPKGIYPVRTVHLKSDVWLYLEKEATIRATKGTDAPETTWFSDRKYRSGLSPNDTGPYAEPENWLTKQDVGHHFFRNAMFSGERIDNVKILGNGRITGDGALVNGDNVMKNAPDNRGDKMFSFKLCTNIEIGGMHSSEDLWYDPATDEPYYIRKDGSKNVDIRNMLQIDRPGHFALLATGTDNLNIHDTYFGKAATTNVRDICDFMGCNNVSATNIYCRVASDDIIKPGSDCSLGYTRPARHYMIRNIIGDTNCNLFQIGSETADDIMDVHVDNIYVLGANKAGFSISTNDGAHIRDVHLNCGHTGPLRERSKMNRTYTPFFISISNRGRILGAEVGKYAFTDQGEKHNELLARNINIGEVENIILNGVDVSDVYAGSSYGNKERWKPYDGSQRRATAIVAGYRLPSSEEVEGGLNFTLPNGKHTGYIHNISFNDVRIIVKGGNSLSDTAAAPPELRLGQYNASNLKLEPSYGVWARHVMDVKLSNCSFNYEKRDSRYAVFLEDVIGARFSDIKTVRARDNKTVVKLKNSSDVSLHNFLFYQDIWGSDPVVLPDTKVVDLRAIAHIPVE